MFKEGASRSGCPWLVVALLAIAVAGCSDERQGRAEERSSSASGRVVEDAMGEKRVPEEVRRVVALEWSYAEALLTLGVEPVGMADLAGYREWVSAGPAPSEEVASVGGRQEPSLESIARLEPDLIIGLRYRSEPAYDTYASIAPTLLFEPYALPEGMSQFEEMRQTFRKIGRAVRRTEQADRVLGDLDAKIEAARERVALLPESQRRFVLVQTFTQQNAPIMRVFADNAMAVQILERIGLENAWEGPEERYGFATVGVEALAKVDEAHLLYVAQADDDAFGQTFSDHPVWRQLPFVQAGKVHALGGDVWFFGGPRSAEMLIERAVEAVAEDGPTQAAGPRGKEAGR